VFNGLLEISTDFEDYFDQIKKTALESNAWAVKQIRVNERIFSGNIMTNYEIKYSNEGRKIFYIELERPVSL
jgi:tRNA G46 methylase TrmB